MLPYIFFIIVLLISTIFDKTKFEKLTFLILSLFLLTFSAFRVGGTGLADYDAYLRLYSKIVNWESVIDPTIHAELGFRLLSFIGNAAGFEGQFIIFSMALLAAIPVLWLINKYSYYPIVSLLFWTPYFLTMNMHSSRISVAVSFGLLFIISFYESRKLSSVILFLIAVSFHSSAICLFLVFLTCFTYRTLLVLIVLALLFGLVFNPFFLIANVFSLIGMDHIAWLIKSYISSEDYGYPMKLYDPRIILSLMTTLLIYNIRKSVIHGFDSYIFKVFFVGVFLMIAFSSVTIIAWRLSYFYLVSCVLVIPLICKYYNFRFFNSFGHIRMMSVFYSFVYVLYTLPIILGAQPYRFYFG
ncbi:EpsG family protein [Shewanella baltica]|uniref:EpsG family protein n=1 Tax=Shewanella baltica TaxID=62322 RepID=UPI00217DDEAA|nr:EpsG family protein [Shewanella baltica]MCS6237817.1 EpsG family protein [Shewanella baltica]MCS6261893.1 EpsG family protein [Shewanella baltica]MCS6272471.1 EpsG family protein [Shewanella baltica]